MAKANLTLKQGFDRVNAFHVKSLNNDAHNAEAV